MVRTVRRPRSSSKNNLHLYHRDAQRSDLCLCLSISLSLTHTHSLICYQSVRQCNRRWPPGERWRYVSEPLAWRKIGVMKSQQEKASLVKDTHTALEPPKQCAVSRTRRTQSERWEREIRRSLVIVFCLKITLPLRLHLAALCDSDLWCIKCGCNITESTQPCTDTHRPDTYKTQ